MIERDYYPLETATKKLNLSKDDLIYLASKGEIRLGVLVGKGILLKQTIDKAGCLIKQEMGGSPSSLTILDPYCLIDYEANPQTAEVVLSIYLGDRQGGNSEIIKVLDPATEQTLLMKNSKLVIYASELKRLQDSESQTKSVYDWLNRAHLSLHELLLLSLEEAPDDKDLPFFDSIGLNNDEAYIERRNEAEGWIRGEKLHAVRVNNAGSVEYRKIDPVSFFKLAKSKKWDLPQQIIDFLYEYQTQQAEFDEDPRLKYPISSVKRYHFQSLCSDGKPITTLLMNYALPKN